jgi:hypothetical protein
MIPLYQKSPDSRARPSQHKSRPYIKLKQRKILFYESLREKSKERFVFKFTKKLIFLFLRRKLALHGEI